MSLLDAAADTLCILFLGRRRQQDRYAYLALASSLELRGPCLSSADLQAKALADYWAVLERIDLAGPGTATADVAEFSVASVELFEAVHNHLGQGNEYATFYWLSGEVLTAIGEQRWRDIRGLIEKANRALATGEFV